MITKGNIFRPVLPEESGKETFEAILKSDNLLLERIVSHGQTTPPGEWYDQEHDEWVILLQGDAILAYENGDTIELSAGDYLLIPSHCRHRVERTTTDPPCVWLALHGKL